MSFDIVSYLLGEKNAGMVKDSWSAVMKAVNGGIAKKLMPVGTQIFDEWYESAGTKYDIPWDVVHYNAAGDMYLKWHYGFKNTIAFDAPEAIYFAPEEGLPAGQYYITIGYAYGTGWVKDDNINFTLNEDMDAGDQLVINTNTNPANDPTDGATWNVYAKGSTTSKDTGVTSNSSAGTKLGSTSATGVGYTNGNINAPQRVVYGYNRYSQSAIRQWLNSDGAAGAWWVPQNDWDRPPAQHTTVRGFVAGLSEEFLSIVKPVDIVTAINTVEGSAETEETTHDRFFLPSLQEMYIAPQLANTEGEDWDYFKELAEEEGLPGKFQQSGTYEILKTYYIHNKASACGARLRSAYRGGAGSTWYVYTSGYVGSSSAYTANSGSPACILKKSS